MSTAPVAAGQTTPPAPTSRSGWLASLRSEAVSFLKGDNNAPWAILAETVIGCVPILGQVVDARDILKGLVEVSGAPASGLAWFNLITALIGLVPGAGDAVKRALRSVKFGATHVDDLLDMIRRFYKGDPEKALREALDLSALRRYLDRILDNPNLTRRLSPDVRRSIDEIQANLGRQFEAFKREVDGWLHKGRKTSAEPPAPGRAAPAAPPAKPGTHARAGSTNQTGTGSHASPNTPNAASQRTARFKTLSQKVLGVMGEHMADYHCQDVKGWGPKVAHDENGVNSAKLNDRGHLIPLWPPIPRGRGIDAVWRSGGRKPYAVIEAKASYNPLKTLGALLGEAGDKTQAASGGGSKRRRNGTGSQAEAGAGAPRQANGNVTQMSHSWIERRLPQALAAAPNDLARIRGLKEAAYDRHVLLFSIPQAVLHAEGLILHTAGQPVRHDLHATHQVTREWGDIEIDMVSNARAAAPSAKRRNL